MGPRLAAAPAVAAVVAAVVAALALGCSKPATQLLDAGVPFADGRMAPGQRQIERIQYNEVNDVYRVFLVGRLKADDPERLQYLRLAHLPKGKDDKPYLAVDQNGPVAYIGSTFGIGIQHAYVEQRADLATGNNVNVVTRMEKRFWYPFGGKPIPDGADPFAEPMFYYPPVLADKGPAMGVGGKGPTKEAASQAYRAANGVLPLGVKLHTEGFLAETPATNPDAGPVGGGLALPNVPANDPIVGGSNNRIMSGTSPLMTPHGKKPVKGKAPPPKKKKVK